MTKRGPVYMQPFNVDRWREAMATFGGNVMMKQAPSKEHLRPGTLTDAAQAYLTQLFQHPENDHPDVHELELGVEP